MLDEVTCVYTARDDADPPPLDQPHPPPPGPFGGFSGTGVTTCHPAQVGSPTELLGDTTQIEIVAVFPVAVPSNTVYENVANHTNHTEGV